MSPRRPTTSRLEQAEFDRKVGGVSYATQRTVTLELSANEFTARSSQVATVAVSSTSTNAPDVDPVGIRVYDRAESVVYDSGVTTTSVVSGRTRQAVVRFVAPAPGDYAVTGYFTDGTETPALRIKSVASAP